MAHCGLWYKRNWRTLPASHPKSSYSDFCLRDKWALACYREGTCIDGQCYSWCYCQYGPVARLEFNSSFTCCLCIPGLHVYSPTSRHHNPPSCLDENSSQCISWQQANFCWSRHLRTIQSPEATCLHTLYCVYQAFQYYWQLRHTIYRTTTYWSCKRSMLSNKHEGWAPTNDHLAWATWKSGLSWEIHQLAPWRPD